MEDAAQKPEKPTPSMLKRMGVGSRKHTRSLEMEGVLGNDTSCPPKKTKPSESEYVFQTTAAGGSVTLSSSESHVRRSSSVIGFIITGASREVSMLLSEFADVLSERAVTDKSQMKELEDILTQARQLESNLKEKKNKLKQKLALISDKLQG